MIQFILVATMICISGDSINFNPVSVHKSYTKDIIISAGLGVVLGMGAYVCHNKAELAYDAYKSDSTLKQTVNDWNTVVKYDTYKNILGIGSILCIGRAVYYQLKSVKASKNAYLPKLDIRYAHNNKITFGIKQKI